MLFGTAAEGNGSFGCRRSENRRGEMTTRTWESRCHGEPEQEIVPYVLLKELQPGFLSGVTGVYHMPKGY